MILSFICETNMISNAFSFIEILDCQRIKQLLKMWNFGHKLKIWYHATLIYFHEFDFGSNQVYNWWYLKIFIVFSFEENKSIGKTINQLIVTTSNVIKWLLPIVILHTLEIDHVVDIIEISFRML